jgi:hypothetical protein
MAEDYTRKDCQSALSHWLLHCNTDRKILAVAKGGRLTREGRMMVDVARDMAKGTRLFSVTSFRDVKKGGVVYRAHRTNKKAPQSDSPQRTAPSLGRGR